ncbi:N-acetylmuramic acid 6-phosphate etherase [Niveispirillum sp. KHB5.9]|uniref:N-acetylmuramic acid 6-phosphate etherase n=1 Tax=Niveispirillum sp. KHB5.9 TaxID=3400269 RepID=UPI003A881CDA
MSATEKVGQRFRELDLWSTPDILEALWGGQGRAVSACLATLPALSRAVDDAASRVGSEGRLIYVGAGSSAVLAALDGLELPGTFSFPLTRIELVLAGISDLRQGFDGAVEDAGDAGADAVRALNPGSADIVIGVSASGRSAFTVGALDVARAAGALTIGIASNDGSPLLLAVEYPLFVDSGEEVIAGSTRLAAGTAQKLLLNLFSTALMVRLGGVHGNLMVNLRVNNVKLQARALDILRQITGADEGTAAQALADCGGALKPAALVLLRGLAPDAARAALLDAGDNLRLALG